MKIPRKEPQLFLQSYSWKKKFSLLVSKLKTWQELSQGNSWWMFTDFSRRNTMPAKRRGQCCALAEHPQTGLLRSWELTQVLSPLLSLTRHYIAAWWRNPPLWGQAGDLSLWLIEFRGCRQEADSLTPFPSLHSTDCLGHPGVHPAKPWLPLAAWKSPLKTETLLNILWFDLHGTSHQVLLLFMAKYPQARESNFYPFSFRHKFAVSKWRWHRWQSEGGKKPSTSCENCPFNFHEKIWDKNKTNVLLAVSFLTGVVDSEQFLSLFNS